MTWLGNLKIRSKLFGSFGIIVALMVGVGILSLIKLGGLQADIENITKFLYPKTQWASDISQNVLQVEIAVRDGVLADNREEIANALSHINDSVKTITERIELFQKNVKTEKGKELVQKYIDADKISRGTREGDSLPKGWQTEGSWSGSETSGTSSRTIS